MKFVQGLPLIFQLFRSFALEALPPNLFKVDEVLAASLIFFGQDFQELSQDVFLPCFGRPSASARRGTSGRCIAKDECSDHEACSLHVGSRGSEGPIHTVVVSFTRAEVLQLQRGTSDQDWLLSRSCREETRSNVKREA